MKNIILSTLLCWFLNCTTLEAQYVNQSEFLAINRIETIYNLKESKREVWQAFSNTAYDIPLIYYADNACYIVNPTIRFLDMYKPQKLSNNSSLEIYKSELIDSIRFHMHVSVSYDDSLANFDYKQPYMRCSSYELSSIRVPMESENEWYTMIFHEMFHGFQLMHPSFFEYFANITSNEKFKQVELSNLYTTQQWFKESIERENDMLLDALVLKNPIPILKEYVKLRELRYKHALAECDIDIAQFEPIFETMEGSARYFEYYIYPNLYDLKTNKWLYIAGKNYFYSTGFNLLRLFDKLKIEYKSQLFYSNLSLYDMLKSNINK